MIDDVRKHRRFDVEIAIKWGIEGQSLSGTGTLLDVSLPGACFRMETPFTAAAGMVFTLESADVPSLPKRGRLRWYRRLPGRAPKFLLGVIFVNDNQDQSAWVTFLESQVAAADNQQTA